MKIRKIADFAAKERLYIMLDKKSANYALVKTGMSTDKLKRRMNGYRTANPLLRLIDTVEIRKGTNIWEVESKFHELLAKQYEHLYGEWYVITDSAEIKAIEKHGFKHFDELKWYVKNRTHYNTRVVDLW